MRQLDYTVLQQPTAPGEATFRKHRPLPALVGVFFVVILGCFVAGLFLLGIAVQSSEHPGRALYAGISSAVNFLISAGIIITAVVYFRKTSVVLPLLTQRLERFAAENNLDFTQRADVDLPGELFSRGEVSYLYRRLSLAEDPGVQVGEFHYTVKAGKTRINHLYTYVAVRLNRLLPHLVLVPRGEVSASTIDPTQIHSLEGDFDNYFALYTPDGFETDALYVFTPEVMAAMIDNAALWRGEIVDDWLLFTRPETLFHATADDYRRVFALAGAGLELRDQSKRYSDSRSLIRNTVSPSGRALRTRSERILFGLLCIAGMIAIPFVQIMIAAFL